MLNYGSLKKDTKTNAVMNFDFKKFWLNIDKTQKSISNAQTDDTQAALYRLKLLKKRMLVGKINKSTLFSKINNSIFKFRYLGLKERNRVTKSLL